MALQVVRSQVISFNCLTVIPVSFLMVSYQLGRPFPLFPLTSPSKMSFSRNWLRMMCPKFNNFCLVTLASSDVHGLIRSNFSWSVILAVHGILSSRLQHQSANASILLLSTLLSVQVSHPYVAIAKTISFTNLHLVARLMSLFFYIRAMPTIARRPIAILRLISGVHSPSLSIVEPRKVKLSTSSTSFPFTTILIFALSAVVIILVFLTLRYRLYLSLSSFTFPCSVSKVLLALR